MSTNEQLEEELKSHFVLRVCSPDGGRISVNLLKDKTPIAFSWIPNVLKLVKDDEITDVILKNVIVQEAANGGRSNQKKYSSVAEYLKDPVVKDNCRKYLVGGLASRVTYTGEPDKVDKTYTLLIAGKQEIKVVAKGYDSLIPQAWYNEFFADVIEKLQTKNIYTTATEALNELKFTEDLFGPRLFFVIKAPVAFKDSIEEIASSFKAKSHALTTDEFVFIGIRSKLRELDGIARIYAQSGWVLQDQSWDWA